MEFFHLPHSPILGDWKREESSGKPFEGGIIRGEAHTPGAETGLTIWQGDAGSGGCVWHPSTHSPVLGGEGPQVTVRAAPPCSHLPHCRDGISP